MVVAVPDATLLTACERGYGKRTYFGPGSATSEGEPEEEEAASRGGAEGAESSAVTEGVAVDEGGEESSSGQQRYRTQRRGGKGLRDIKTTKRNGPVVSIASVTDDHELIMMSSGGKLQRIRAADVSIVGRNTQGVRIMTLDEGDTLAAVVRVPREAAEVDQEA
jgi:DNA gyrase subunit A